MARAGVDGGGGDGGGDDEGWVAAVGCCELTTTRAVWTLSRAALDCLKRLERKRAPSTPRSRDTSGIHLGLALNPVASALGGLLSQIWPRQGSASE